MASKLSAAVVLAIVQAELDRRAGKSLDGEVKRLALNYCVDGLQRLDWVAVEYDKKTLEAGPNNPEALKISWSETAGKDNSQVKYGKKARKTMAARERRRSKAAASVDAGAPNMLARSALADITQNPGSIRVAHIDALAGGLHQMTSREIHILGMALVDGYKQNPNTEHAVTTILDHIRSLRVPIRRDIMPGGDDVAGGPQTPPPAPPPGSNSGDAAKPVSDQDARDIVGVLVDLFGKPGIPEKDLDKASRKVENLIAKVVEDVVDEKKKDEEVPPEDRVVEPAKAVEPDGAPKEEPPEEGVVDIDREAARIVDERIAKHGKPVSDRIRKTMVEQEKKKLAGIDPKAPAPVAPKEPVADRNVDDVKPAPDKAEAARLREKQKAIREDRELKERLDKKYPGGKIAPHDPSKNLWDVTFDELKENPDYADMVSLNMDNPNKYLRQWIDAVNERAASSPADIKNEVLFDAVNRIGDAEGFDKVIEEAKRRRDAAANSAVVEKTGRGETKVRPSGVDDAARLFAYNARRMVARQEEGYDPLDVVADELHFAMSKLSGDAASEYARHLATHVLGDQADKTSVDNFVKKVMDENKTEAARSIVAAVSGKPTDVVPAPANEPRKDGRVLVNREPPIGDKPQRRKPKPNVSKPISGITAKPNIFIGMHVGELEKIGADSVDSLDDKDFHKLSRSLDSAWSRIKQRGDEEWMERLAPLVAAVGSRKEKERRDVADKLERRFENRDHALRDEELAKKADRRVPATSGEFVVELADGSDVKRTLSVGDGDVKFQKRMTNGSLVDVEGQVFVDSTYPRAKFAIAKDSDVGGISISHVASGLMVANGRNVKDAMTKFARRMTGNAAKFEEVLRQHGESDKSTVDSKRRVIDKIAGSDKELADTLGVVSDAGRGMLSKLHDSIRSANPGLSDDDVKNVVRGAAKSMSGIPHHAIDKMAADVTDVTYINSRDDLYKEYMAFGGDASKRPVGFYSREKRAIRWDGGDLGDGGVYAGSVCAHEMAHGLSYAIGGYDRPLHNRKEFREAWQRELVDLSGDADHVQLSEYAKKSAREGFAELGRFVFEAGHDGVAQRLDVARKNWPKMTAFFEKTVMDPKWADGAADASKPVSKARDEEDDLLTMAGHRGGDFADRFRDVFNRLDRERGFNHVSIAKLRKEFPELTRDEFDAEIKQLRRSGEFSLTGAEGLDGLPQDERDAAIREEGDILTGVSRKGPPRSPVVPRAEVKKSDQPPKEFRGRLVDVFKKLDRDRGGFNLVSLAKLRREFQEVPREEFDRAIRQLQRDGVVSLTPAEGLDGLPQEERDAAIPGDGEMLHNVSLRPQRPVEGNRSGATANVMRDTPKASKGDQLNATLDDDDIETKSNEEWEPEELITESMAFLKATDRHYKKVLNSEKNKKKIIDRLLKTHRDDVDIARMGDGKKELQAMSRIEEEIMRLCDEIVDGTF